MTQLNLDLRSRRMLLADWFGRLAVDSGLDLAQHVGEAWLFPAPSGTGHVRVDTANKWLRRAEGIAKVEHVRGFGFHSLRRAFATKRKGGSIKDVAALGGWKGVQVLQDLYQAADMDGMEAALMAGREVRLRGTR